MSPGDLDLVMSHGLGLRYAFLGPLETMHLNAEGRPGRVPAVCAASVLWVRSCHSAVAAASRSSAVLCRE